MSTQREPGGAPVFEMRHRLALALEVAQLKPETIALEIGLSVTTIRNYLSGRTQPKRAVIIAWGLRCGVDTDWLETGEPTSAGRPDGGPGMSRETASDQDIQPPTWQDEHAGHVVPFRRAA